MTEEPVRSGGADPNYRAIFATLPTACLLLDTDLLVVDMTDRYLELTGRRREHLLGRQVLESFPLNPADPAATRRRQDLLRSLRRVLRTGRPDRLPTFRYDVERGPGSGRFQERWWSVLNVPVHGPDGEVTQLLNGVEDVTAVVRERRLGHEHRRRGDDLVARAARLEADLVDRGRQVQALSRAEAETAQRLQALAFVALALAAAETVEELTDLVVGRGVAAMGCHSGGVAVRDDERGIVNLTITDTGGEGEHLFQQMSLTTHLPSVVAAVVPEPIYLGDERAGMAWGPEMARVYESSGRSAWASLPLMVDDRLLGSLTVSWREPRTFSDAEKEVLAAFASQCAQALHRIQVRTAEREALTSSRLLSEALQRSLLPDPPQPERLQVAVRYLPAARGAYVGGDWYDAFVVPDGQTLLVVGDVAGHDREAAAAMGQIRNLLRGVAHSLEETPAVILTALDLAMADLTVNALATALVMKIETDDEGVGQVLHWANAGHPPPLLIHAGGEAELLRREPELLLGVEPSSYRTDHQQVLQPGDTVLLFTDGLVERRGETLTQGMEWLRRRSGALAGITLDALCDTLLAELPRQREDDVALLAVRARPVGVERPGSPTQATLADVPARAPTVAAPAQADLVLAADLAAVRRARHFVRHHCLSAGVTDDVADTVELLTSETVTNAIMHGRSEARLRALVQPDVVRVEIGDDNARHPQRAERNDEALDGRGLDIVELLARSWGVHDQAGGKVVWFEVERGRESVSGDGR
jgi:serine phosphatase RsbU (regulator of sigma subunit)/anti-sigma regulatory factor (Ser/Thr protein kinase)